MWIWGVGSRLGVVPNGLREQRRCEECEKVTEFWEANVTDKLHVFFVDVAGTRQRRMVCRECGHDEPVETSARSQASAPATPRPSAPVRPRERPSDKELSADLAALKRKMGL
jgi:hypothetical protein